MSLPTFHEGERAAALQLSTNVQFITIKATKMPFVRKG